MMELRWRWFSWARRGRAAVSTVELVYQKPPILRFYWVVSGVAAVVRDTIAAAASCLCVCWWVRRPLLLEQSHAPSWAVARPCACACHGRVRWGGPPGRGEPGSFLIHVVTLNDVCKRQSAQLGVASR